jgi:hypothetical protein
LERSAGLGWITPRKRWKGTFRVSSKTSKEKITMGGRLLRLEVGASYDIFCLHGAGSQ